MAVGIGRVHLRHCECFDHDTAMGHSRPFQREVDFELLMVGFDLQNFFIYVLNKILKINYHV